MSVLLVFVCERERGGTCILHMKKILEKYLPFGKSENAWDHRMPPWNVSLFQIVKKIKKQKPSKISNL